MAAYGRNLNDEVERLQNRQDYTKYRNDGLLSLIDDCNEKLTSLRDLANVYGSCSTDMRNLTTPKRAIDTISHYEQTAKHQRIAIEPNEIATPDQSKSLFNFKLLKINKIPMSFLQVYTVRIVWKPVHVLFVHFACLNYTMTLKKLFPAMTL